MAGRAEPTATTDRNESAWFGTTSEAEARGVTQEALGAPSEFESDEWFTSEVADSPGLSPEARRIAQEGLSELQRLFRDFVAARAALSLALLGIELIAANFGARGPEDLALALCSAYVVFTTLLWLRPLDAGRVRVGRGHLSPRQGLLTIGVDVLIFGLLQWSSAGNGLNYGALMVLPALMAGALTPRRHALAVAAACSLVLLAIAWQAREAASSAPLLITQAGLAGIGLFAVVLLAGGLAARLANEERSARGSLEMARRQVQLNRLVLEEMQDGVLVVDRAGHVRAANPAARALLGGALAGASEGLALLSVAGWGPLAAAINRAFLEGVWPEGGCDLTLPSDPGKARGARHLRVRGRFTQHRGSDRQEDFCVLFLEDFRTVQARMRQEKLAAMGRVSAGIAHEIRNPLAAIVQANALLAEDAKTPQQQQLTRMVAEHAERLRRIVEDVMEVVPGPAPLVATLDATAQTANIYSEWARAGGWPLGADSPLRVELPNEPLGVRFDGEHLRRVLVNLLDNAVLHGTGGAASIRLELLPAHPHRALLRVASDGPPIPPEVERYLFEPFFSTRSRGTGLGLYISRELCGRYGATIEYRTRGEGAERRNEFEISMQRQPLTATDPRLHPSP